MIFFNTIKSNLSKLGLGLNQRPFNEIQLRHTLKATSSLISLNIFLFHEAKSSKEYMDAFLMTTEGMLIFMAFFSSISQIANISLMIDSVEKIMEKRELGWKSIDYTLI